MKLVKLLAAKFGVKETDKAVLEAIDELVEAVEAAKTSLGADKATAKAILAKVEEITLGAMRTKDTLSKVGKLLGLDPSADVDEILARAQEQAEAEVDEVMSANKWTSLGIRAALLTLRMQDAKAFAEKFPPPKVRAKKMSTTATRTRKTR